MGILIRGPVRSPKSTPKPPKTAVISLGAILGGIMSLGINITPLTQNPKIATKGQKIAVITKGE